MPADERVNRPVPDVTPEVCKGGSGHLAVGPLDWTLSQSALVGPRISGRLDIGGVYMSQHLSFAMFGTAVLRTPAEVRIKFWKSDRRASQGACGTVVVMGAGLRPVGELMELPLNPETTRAPHFYPDRHQ